MRKAGSAFTLVEIMIVVAIIGLLAVIAIPSFMRARVTSQQNACINNLRLIEAAKDQYALEFGLTNGARIGLTDIGFFNMMLASGGVTGLAYLRNFPFCPVSTNRLTWGGQLNAAVSAADYTPGVIGSNAICNIVGTTHLLK